jgi:outer membrane protein OmpA-like peptidoglycan-associated protein
MIRLTSAKYLLLATMLMSGVVMTSPGSAGAAEKAVDINAIITGLAPIEYLPQHTGSTRRAIDLDIRFKVGSADLTRDARRQLDVVIEALHRRELQGQRFQVVGHTDASGGARANLVLSRHRAASVRKYLISQGAIHPGRLISSGRGEERLKNTLLPKSSENRRVEFILVPTKTSAPTVQKRSGTEKVIKW